ncbi:hypothetical protein [Ralstonia pseudosolanacearum]|uniref:hypothetical protein n=1 Tax=Ralstonia pseudosolanacearum TaxID=1310165 RepID=UPI003CF40BF5
MNKFLLQPLRSLGKVTDEQVDQLRAIPGLHVSRALVYIVLVSFEGEAAALQSLLAGTAWDPDRLGENRTYRLQSLDELLAARTRAKQTGPNLDEVLMQFAVERRLPTRGQLHRYLEMFPQFRHEIIEFAVSLVEDHFHPGPEDADQNPSLLLP